MPAVRNSKAPRRSNMSKRFLVAWVVMFVAWMVEGFVVHGLLLSANYLTLPQLFRAQADAQGYFGWMLLAHVLVAGAYVWIYERGISPDRPWLGQGLRFGIAVAVLTAVPTYLIYYAVQPLPGALVVKQIVLDAIGIVILGVIVAWLYRRRPARRGAHRQDALMASSVASSRRTRIERECAADATSLPKRAV
jgi:hypothetical protein